MPDDKLFPPRASESAHWYDREGHAVYQTLSADGKKMVDCDIRHARKLNLVPGVTSIINCAARPALDLWKIEQSILASLTLPRRPHEKDAEFIKRVIDDSQQQAKQAAELGTAIHTAIECALSNRPYDPAMKAYVEGAQERLEHEFGKRTWVCEQSFANRLGFGSKIDLESEDGEIIVDTKGKDFLEAPTKENKIKLHWDEHAMQLGAYRKHRTGRSVIHANLFVSRNAPGLTHVHRWDTEDLDRGFGCFSALLAYWMVKNRYASGW
jgi:hypothetical protein